MKPTKDNELKDFIFMWKSAFLSMSHKSNGGEPSDVFIRERAGRSRMPL